MPKSQRAASRKGRGSLELFQTLTPLIFCQPSPGDSSSPQLHLLPAPSHLAVWKGLASPRRASPCSLLQASDRAWYTSQQHWGLCRAAQLPGSALVGPGWSLPSTSSPRASLERPQAPCWLRSRGTASVSRAPDL